MSDSPPRSAKVALRLFGFWAELPKEELTKRLAWLQGRDTEIFGQVTALVQADQRAGAFLEKQSSGEQIGAWTLEKLLGAGGMGQVWLARRHDGLYKGQAAIKMLHRRASVTGASERFAREGQLLGRLSHPNIARLLDAGVTADGRRYLVLEHVDGRRLDEECDARKLDTKARLELFRQVCDAVIHAHANLVVHRDLKPSNVLVTGEGQVKLLDFGVAKLLEGEEERITQWAGAALTPAYAAPEQLEGGPITTATDVYALGVILHELLTGALPRGPRQVQLTGDLDVIVGKALKQDPSERYANAQALQDDVTRFLKQEPIAARPDSAGYRARKFVRRHRALVAATGVTMLALIGGVAGVSWQARIARQQARTAEAAQAFLIGLFEANSTEKSSSVEAQATTARELLDLGKKRLDTELKDEPAVRLQMLQTLAEMYFQIGRNDEAESLDRERVELLKAMGRARSLEMARALSNHGITLDAMDRTAEAAARFQEALRLLESMGTRDSEEGARVLWSIAEQKRHESPGDAIPLLEESVGLFRRYPASGQLPGAFSMLASLYGGRGRLQDADQTLQEGLGLVRKSHEPGSLFEITLLSELAEVLLRRNRFGEALPALQETYRLRTVRLGLQHEDTLYSRAGLAILLARAGQRAQALEHVDAVIAANGEDASRMPPQQWGRAHFHKGQILLDAGHVQGAREALDRIGPLWDQKLAKTGLYGRYLLTRARLRLLEGDPASAIELARKARALIQGLGVPCHVGGWVADQTLATALQDAGQLEEAAPLVRAIDQCTSAEVDGTPLRVAASLGKAREALARRDPARVLAESEAALQKISGSPDRAFYALEEAEAQRLSGGALASLGRAEEGKPRLRSSLALLESRQVPDSPAIQGLRAELAALR